MLLPVEVEKLTPWQLRFHPSSRPCTAAAFQTQPAQKKHFVLSPPVRRAEQQLQERPEGLALARTAGRGQASSGTSRPGGRPTLRDERPQQAAAEGNQRKTMRKPPRLPQTQSPVTPWCRPSGPARRPVPALVRGRPSGQQLGAGLRAGPPPAHGPWENHQQPSGGGAARSGGSR